MIDFFASLIDLLVGGFNLLASTFINGVQFLAATITSIPLLIIDCLNSLPDFFKVGLTGLFGLLMCVVFLKFLKLLNILS